MADPFVGQLSLVGFNFAPIGWALAQGQLLSIRQYTALFSLIGTYYGGDGISNFALPNLQGNVPVGYGQGPGLSSYSLGETGGTPTITLNSNQTPVHTHTPKAAAARVPVSSPVGGSFSDSEAGSVYSASTSPLTQMSPSSVPNYGANQPHNNLMPYLGMYWVIALQGVFPSRG